MGGQKEDGEGGKEEGGSESEEELIKVEPDRAEYHVRDALTRSLTSTHKIFNLSRHPLAIKIKCTRLDLFTIRPGTSLIPPSGSLTLTVRLHQLHPDDRPAIKDQFLYVHYLRYLDELPSGSKPDLPAFFNRKGGGDRVPVLLRFLKDRTGTSSSRSRKHHHHHHLDNHSSYAAQSAEPKTNLHGAVSNPGSDITDRGESQVMDDKLLLPLPAKKTTVLTAEKSHPKFLESISSPKACEKSPPLQLEDPKLRCLFFPPFDQANQTSFNISNPSATDRMAVKVRCSDTEQFRIKPSSFFLAPKESQEIFVQRVPIKEPRIRAELLEFLNYPVDAKERDVKAALATVDRSAMGRVKVDLDVRTDPYLESTETMVLFHKPHTLKSVAVLNVRNFSPLYALAKCLCSNNDIFHINPVRMLIAPHASQLIHFTVHKLPITEAAIEVQYARTSEEVGQKRPKGKELHDLVEDVVKHAKGGERRYKIAAELRPSEDLALEPRPDLATLKFNDAKRQWYGAVSLQNRSSASVAVKVKTMDPERYVMSAARMLVEAGGERELTITEKVRVSEGRGSCQDSILKLDYAFRLPHKELNEVLDEAKTASAFASIRVPIVYETASENPP